MKIFPFLWGRFRTLLSPARHLAGAPAGGGHAVAVHGSGDIVFSEAQRQVIALDSGRHLVLAPPGTGKTEMLAQRILWAVGHGTDPRRMVCLTFTIRAARNMEARIATRINATLPVTIGNVHHYCATLLRERHLAPRNWTVIDEPAQREFMGEVLDGLPADEHRLLEGARGTPPVDDILKVCCALRQKELRFPADIGDDPRRHRLYQSHPALLERISRDFRAHKETYAALDFDDLLNYAYVFIVRQNRLTEEEKFSWVQVDEVQDLSPLQWAIIRGLEAPQAHCVYLGDAEQAIFSFMGASPAHLAAMAQSCRLHNLQQNFRSPSYLLNVFTKYASANLKPHWIQPPLPAVRKAPGRDDLLLLTVNGTEDDEARALMGLLQSPVQRTRANRQTAILLRDNKAAEAYASLFEQQNIPVFKISGNDLMHSALMLDIKAYLATLTHPDDLLSWSRMFCLFGATRTQRAARALVKSLRDAALLPQDLMEESWSENHLTVSDRFLQAVEGGRVVVFDTETTGLDTAEDDIIQIAAAEYRNGIRRAMFNVYLRTDNPFGDSAATHHISPRLLQEQGLPPAEGLRRFREFAEGAVLAAHNLKFDLAMLINNSARRWQEPPGWERATMLDTLALARRLHPDLTSHTLSNLIEALDLEGQNTHDARDDVMATGSLLLRLRDDARAVSARQSECLRQHAPALRRFAAAYRPLWRRFHDNPHAETTLRKEISHFVSCLRSPDTMTDEVAEYELRLEKFLKYADARFEPEAAEALLQKAHPIIARLREADLLLGDEQYVVSTIHKAKGLEFDCVVIPRCIDGVHPHYFSTMAPDKVQAVAEDARVLYVAMTRARRQLIVSWPTRHGPQARESMPSPFLKPIMGSFALRKG